MKIQKKILAAIVFVASIVIIGTTALVRSSRAETLPVDWTIVYQIGAPSSPNKNFSITFQKGNCRKCTVNCKSFTGGAGSVVTVTTSEGGSFIFTKPGSYTFETNSSNNSITISISASGSSTNTVASGTIECG